jgi:pectate lyase
MLGHARPLRKLILILAAMLALACAAPMAAAQSVPMLVQAEAMTLSSPMAAGYDIAAMGGRFISPVSGTSTMFPSRSASVEVTIPAAGTYYLWARIAGATDTSDALYVGIDSSFDRVFPPVLAAYQWVRVETSDGSGAHGFPLTSGTHTIQVGHGEIGAKLDALYLTANASEVPNFTAPTRLLIEAEAMNRASPMTLGSEATALGGQFISPTSGATSTAPVREASVAVQMPAGTWYLWARIAGPTMTSDALYVGINTSFDRVFPSAQGPYQWVRVETTEASGAHGFVLGAGAHTVQVGHGEIGAKLDAVYLTNDAAEVPSFAPMRRVIEAESFTLQSPMTVGVDAAASGAQYISPTSGSTSTAPVREAFTSVTAPVSGTYYLWARLWGATDTSDALYLGFNGAWQRVFPSALGAYEWVRVEEATLSAGEHVIQVGHGEIGARLDAVYVTDSATDSPAGSTPPPSSGFPAACALPSGGYEGFGRNTLRDPNLPARQVYVVNSLSDPGTAGTPGTLRDALSQPNRCIVFSVGGTITLSNLVRVRSNVMIDGFTAPSPGITLRNEATWNPDGGVPIFGIWGTTSVPLNNVVIRGLRIRRSQEDGMSIRDAFNVVIDRVSITGFGDGALDVTQNSRNVTIQWSILGDGNPEHNLVSLITFNTARVSVHHNLYIKGGGRQPFCGRDNSSSTQLPAEIVCDVRNNLVWGYESGTEIRTFGTANVINNYYSKAGAPGNPSRTIIIDGNSVAFTSGNVSQDGFSINNGNRSTPFPVDSADVPTTTDARTAALAVEAGAGARGPNFGLDSKDQAFIDGISIP